MADEENSLTEVPATNEEVADSTEAPPTGVEGKPEEQLVTEDTATPGETDNTANQGENTADVLPLEDEAAVAEPAEGEEKTQAETDVPVEGTTTGAEGNGEPEVKGEEGESQPPAEAEEGESRPPAAAEEGESQPPAAAEEGESQPPAATEEGEFQSPAAAEEGESQPPAAVEVADQEDGQTQPQELSLDGVPPEDESPQTADGKETELGDQPPQGGAEQQPKEGEQPQKSTLGSEEQPKEGVEGEPVSPVPQADTFENGERTESPVAVGEKLSREPTPEKQPIEVSEEYPQAATPEQEVDKEEELEEYEEFEDDLELEEPLHDREELIKEYHEAMSKREALQQQNHQLQHKLADYFRKKKQDDQRQDMDKNVTDQEQRYLKYMANLEDLRRQDSDMRERTKLHIEEIRERCEDKQSRVDYETDRYGEFKKQIALNSINSRSGKPILPKDIETYLSNEAKKEAEVVHVRLENIKLKNKLKKKEQQLKSKEELAEGLHLIDFEQLKIENQTYNEKIEERNEELLKLRKKITGNVQVLTHLKEKLQFVQAENQVLKGDLRDVEGTVAIKRDILSRTKQARDALRIDNHRLRQNCGLLGNEPLLRDFEERKDESDELKSRLEKLKMEHAELTLNASSFRRKIEQARSGRV